MKRQIIIFGIFSLLLFLSQASFADRNGFVRRVVIDPGHGGRDPGAIGQKAMEKDIVLNISLRLGQYIEDAFDDVEVIYTRTTDEFVHLRTRTEIANESKADLFISIHCNASPSNRAFGTETFVMGLHKSQQNLEVAKKENASILYEEDYMEVYDGYDPNSPEANIIFSMFQNAYLNQSLSMASLVQNQFRERAGRHDRGVKQAGFLVLYNIAMPSILVEAGFLSNPQEEKYLMSEMGQAHIASAIFRAFRDYKTQQDKLASLQLAGSTPAASSTWAETAQETLQQQAEQVVVSSSGYELPVISYRVQIATTSVEKPVDAPEFNNLDGVSFYFHEGLYKYTVGNEPTMEDASQIQRTLHSQGFPDAFIVAFKDNERISAAEAIRLQSQNVTNP